MDPIQQRLQAVYQHKPESDIDRKLKSASTTVLDQRITFHDASKVTTCPNSQLKGKYLFMKPSTNMQSMKPSSNNVPGHTVTPFKKDSDSKNNNAARTSLTKENDCQHVSGYVERKVQSRSKSSLAKISRSRSPLTRKFRSRSPQTRQSRSKTPQTTTSGSKSPLSRVTRSRSPLTRKSRSRSPLTRKSGSRSPLTRKSRSRSPLIRKSKSKSPLSRISRSRSPSTRKSRSRSPLARKSRSRSPPARKSRSRSPLTRKSRSRSPLTRKSRSRSPLRRKSRSRSPLARKSRSRSPLTGKSRSRSPPARTSRSRSPPAKKSRSRSPPSRKPRSRSSLPKNSRSRSPLARRPKSKSRSKSPLARRDRSRSSLLRKLENEDAESSKKKVKKRKKKAYLTPFYVKDSDSETEIVQFDRSQIANEDSAKSGLCSHTPGSSSDRETGHSDKKQPARKLPSILRRSSPKPGTSTAEDNNASSDKQIHRKESGKKLSNHYPCFVHGDGRLEISTQKNSEKACISVLPYLVKSKKSHGEKVSGFKIKIKNVEKVVIPPSRKASPKDTKKSVKEKQTVKKSGKVKKKKKKKHLPNLSKESSVKTGKAKKKTQHLTPSEKDSEPLVIGKHGTSTRPTVVYTPEERIEMSENNPDGSGSKADEVEETRDWVDFREYLPDFDNLLITQEDGDNMPRPNTVLFPEHRLDYSWKFPEGGCGLVNRGNTCFVNAALQCLTYCPPFVNYLLSGQHAQECRMMNKDRCILCSFTRYLQESLKMMNKHNLVPNWFLNNLYCVAKHFSVGRQEDSHEYLRLSLEQMQKVCLVGHNQLDRYSKETTVVNQIFGGFLRSQVVCLKCKAKSNTYDPFLDISLDIRTCNTLERAFEIFVHPEKLDIENAYKCANCKHKVEALKRFTIHKAPNIMTVQLKRFQAAHDDKFGGHFRGVKINKAIKFPPRLNIRGYMSVRNGPPELYSLYALLFHEGHSANSGHYTCTVKSGNRWFHISDGTKIRTSLHTVNLQDVYVLFYMREDKQQNGIIPNPALKTDLHRGKESKDTQRQPSFSSLPSTSGVQRPTPLGMQKPLTPGVSGVQRPSTSGVQKTSPAGVQKIIGPIKPKIIHTNEFQFKPVKTNSNSGTPGNDIGSPVKRKDMKVTPPKPDTIKIPLATDRNKVSFDIKTPGMAHPPTFTASVEKSTSHISNSQMAKSHSEPALGMAKPRIVMQIKNGKATTIEKSPDGQKKILSDDEEVIARLNEKKSHKKFRKSLLVPYGSESSSDSDSDANKNKETKVKRERKEGDNGVVFDTKLNATTSVPGNIHLMKSISSHVSNGEVSKHKDKVEKTEPTKATSTTESGKSTDSIHSEKFIKHAQSVQDEKTSDKPRSEKAAKTEGNVSNNCQANYNGHHVFMKHPNGGIHIYDTEPMDNKPEAKHHKDDKNHSHNNVKKRKLIEDARIDIVNGEFHIVSDKKPLLTPGEKGHCEAHYEDSEEYRLLKKAKKHKKHKKDKHRDKEQRYETLFNESDHRHHSEEHHVKKHKKKKRKHKDQEYDIEEEHSYKKRRHEEYEEGKAHKHHHHGETAEDRVHKRHRHESESSSSVEFEWVEKKIDTPVKQSKSAAW